MAGRKKSSPRKHSPQRVTPSPPPPSTLRRSMRVQKPSTFKVDKVKEISTADLLDAARLMQEAHQPETLSRRSSKRVAFEDKDMPVPDATYIPSEPCFTAKQRTSLAGSTPLHAFRHASVQDEPAALPQPNFDRRPSAHSRRTSKSSLRTNDASGSFNANASDNIRTSIGSKRSYGNASMSDDLGGELKQARDFENTKRLKTIAWGLPQDPTTHMLSQLRVTPHSLKLSQISEMLNQIQEKIFGSQDGLDIGFSATHFNFNLTTAQSAAWPMHELRTKYIPLYLTTKWLADGSQYGWHKFFTQPSSRQHLVSAILVEWFVERIFKHTAFGLPQTMVDALEDTDREYLHYDAIVRSKQRAAMMKAWLEDSVTLSRITEATRIAADSLAEELMQVLYPLLPPIIFDPLSEDGVTKDVNSGRRGSIAERKQMDRQRKFDEIRDEIGELILDCSALHKAIRLTGINGTIIRMVPHIQKGELFHPTAAVDCVNGQSCNDHMPRDPKEQSELCIKMTCWPRVEAVVPQGLDMAELEAKEKDYRKELVKAKLASNKYQMCIDGDDDDDGSSSSSSDFDSDNSASDSDEFTWDDKDYDWPEVPKDLQDNEGRNPGIFNPETGETNTVKRAAYVTIHPKLCPAKVYCEWTPMPQSRGQTLTEAVTIARSMHAKSLSLKLEDYRIEVWNAWALYGGLAQWGILTTTAIVSICRMYNIPTHIQEIMIQTLNGADRLMKATAPLTTLPITQIPGYIIGNLMTLVEEIWLAMGPFGTALATPVKTLIADPLRRIFEILRLIPASVPGFQEASYKAQQIKRTIGGEAHDLTDNVASIWSSASTAIGVALAAGIATRSRDSTAQAEALRLAAMNDEHPHTAGANVLPNSVFWGQTETGKHAGRNIPANFVFKMGTQGTDGVDYECRPRTVPSSEIQDSPPAKTGPASMHDVLKSRYPYLPESARDSIVSEWQRPRVTPRMAEYVIPDMQSHIDSSKYSHSNLPTDREGDYDWPTASLSASTDNEFDRNAREGADLVAAGRSTSTAPTDFERGARKGEELIESGRAAAATPATANGDVTYTMVEPTPVQRPAFLTRVSDGIQDVIHGWRD